MKRLFFYCLFALALLSLEYTLPACTSDNPPAEDSNEPLYQDRTSSNLPSGALEGLSMDTGVADIDADGDHDIVIANEFRPNILLLNDGTGQFALASDRLPSSDRDSEDVIIADFDRDDDLDIVIVSEDDQINEYYLQKPDGHFSDAGNRLPVTGISNAGITADFNGDGAPDLLIGNNGQNNLLINTGNGHFRDETAERLPTRNDVTQDVELGDVDGDGDLDLIVGNEDQNRLLINDGAGTFTDESEQRLVYRSEAEETREADFGDVDGDGDPDLLFANVQAFVQDALPQNRLLLNDGAGHFRDLTLQQLPKDDDRSFDGDFFDLDGDGDLDIITSNSNRNDFQGPTPYRVYLNDGEGNFTEATTIILPLNARGSGFNVEMADFNGDGKGDLFLASRGTRDLLLMRK